MSDRHVAETFPNFYELVSTGNFKSIYNHKTMISITKLSALQEGAFS